MNLTHTSPDTRNAPVIALHSSASNGGQWAMLANDLEGRFCVHAPNLPGYGKNCLTADTSKTGLASAASAVITEILQYNRPVHLIGHSNGGAIALKVAMLRPDLIKSLALYEPCMFHLLRNGDHTDKDLFAEITAISDALKAGCNVGNAEPGMRSFLDFWNGAGSWDRLPDQAKRKFSAIAGSVVSDFTRVFCEDWDIDQLKGLTMPTLFLMGMDSPQIAQRITGLVCNAMPGAQLALLPGLGHMAPVTDPEWVNLRLFDHVAKAERSATRCFWPLRTAA